MDVPEKWRGYECRDYFESPLAGQGWWDDDAQYWYIEPASRLREDTSLELLVIGGPGVDGILWGYRKGHHGVWGYYVTEDRFAVLAATASELRTGYSTGRIIV